MKFSLVPQEKRFYVLFSQVGDLLSESLAELSKSLLEGRSRHPRLRDLEHQADDITHQIYHLANKTFVTPLDTEDILQLAGSLDDVIDLAEEVADKIDLYAVGEITIHARAMGENLARAGEEIARALEGLEGFRDLEPRRLEVHRLENECDQLMRKAMAELFSDTLPAAELVKWKDIYDLLEATMDACERVANLLEAISIKNA